MRFEVNVGNWEVTQIAYNGKTWCHYMSSLADSADMAKQMVDQSAEYYAKSGYKIAAKVDGPNGELLHIPDEATCAEAFALRD